MSKDAPICLTRGACLLMPPGSAGGLHLLNRAPEGPTWQGVIWGLALISRDPHLTQGTTNWGPLTPGLDLPFLNLWTSISNSSRVYLDHAFFYRLPAITISYSGDFYYLKIGGILLCQNRWTYYVKLVDFFYLKNGGLLLFQNRWTFIHSNPNILFSNLVDFYFQQLRSLFGLWIFISLTGGVFLTVDFYFLKIGGLLLLNTCGLLFP